MQFSIQREILLKLLKAVAGVVERRHQSSPILSHILIQVSSNKISITATDQEVELIAEGELLEPVPLAKSIVSFRKLMDLCRALPEGIDIFFKKENEKMIIRAGKSRFTLSSLPTEEFPYLELKQESVQFSVAKNILRNLINNTAFAMAEQDVRYYLNGMLLEIKQGGLYAIAADGHRLALCSTQVSLPDAMPLRIIVPRKGVLELQRILDEGEEFITLVVGGHCLRIVTDSLTMTSKLLEGRFPEYERIIPSHGDKVVLGQRSLLKEAFLRAAALFSDKFRGVRLQLSSGRLKITATSAEQDEVEEELEVDYQGTDLEIGFNVKYLIDFLSIIQTEVVRFTFSDANNSAKVEGVQGDSGVYVIMPMRI